MSNEIINDTRNRGYITKDSKMLIVPNFRYFVNLSVIKLLINLKFSEYLIPHFFIANFRGNIEETESAKL